jgi:predicted dinucleotide-binding enzyme
VFKTLNHTGVNNMADPVYPNGRAVMFVCGDDDDAKPTVLRLVSELGFDTVDAGALKVARLLEPLAMLWIHLATASGSGPRSRLPCCAGRGRPPETAAA